MSHINVLVVGNDIKSTFAPFQSDCGEKQCDPEYLVFDNKYDAIIREEYKNKTVSGVVMEDGSKRMTTHYKFWNSSKRAHIVPDHLERKEAHYCEVFPTIEECNEFFYNYDFQDGKFGKFVNPNSKWDFYNVLSTFTIKVEKNGDVLLSNDASEFNIDNLSTLFLHDLFGLDVILYDEKWNYVSQSDFEIQDFPADYEVQGVANNLTDFLKGLPHDTQLTMVDCHN